MKIAYINGSPKKEKSNSEILIEMLKEQMESKLQGRHYRINTRYIDEKVCEELFQMDMWVIAFPLYVDAIPSHFLYIMETLEAYGRQLNQDKPKVYLLLNNGFYEGHQNAIAFDVMKNWCVRCDLDYRGGIGLGAGEMLGSLQGVPVGKGPLKNLGDGFKIMIQSMENEQKEEYKDEQKTLINPNFPRFAWKFMATHSFWMKQAKRNGLSKKDMYKTW